MSYISYKGYKFLRVLALIILGVEGFFLGFGAFVLEATFLLIVLGLIPFDIRFLLVPWLGTIFMFLVIYLVNKIPFTASLVYKQLRREYLMYGKKICLPEKENEREGLSIWMNMQDEGHFRSRYAAITFKKAYRVKKMSQEEWEKYYYDMMMKFLPRTNDSSYTAAAQWCCLYAEKHGLADKKSTSKKSSAEKRASYTQDTQNRQAQEQFNHQMQQEQNRQQEQAFEQANTQFNQDTQHQMQQDIDNMNRQAQEQFNQQMLRQQLN